jgi:hypothetical protein
MSNLQSRMQLLGDVHIAPCPSYALLEFFPFSATILVEFFKVFNSLFWGTERGLLSFLGLFARSGIRFLVYQVDYHIPHEGVVRL